MFVVIFCVAVMVVAVSILLAVRALPNQQVGGIHERSAPRVVGQLQPLDFDMKSHEIQKVFAREITSAEEVEARQTASALRHRKVASVKELSPAERSMRFRREALVLLPPQEAVDVAAPSTAEEPLMEESGVEAHDPTL